MVVVVNVFSHAIVDSLANFTYHPSVASWGDPFFTSWHIFIYSFEAVAAIFFLRKDVRFGWGMVGSVLPDIWDWSFGRFLVKYFNYHLPRAHNFVDAVSSTFFFWAPNWREAPAAVFSEIIFVILLFILWRLLYRANVMGDRTPPSIKLLVLLFVFFGFLRLMTFF